MIIDDKTVFNLIVELMEIKDDQHMLQHTQEWIDEVGLEKVFNLVLNMHTFINDNPLEYPYGKDHK